MLVGAIGSIAIFSSKANNVSDTRLILVNQTGDIAHSLSLRNCSGVLVTDDILFTKNNFTYYLEGRDTNNVNFVHKIPSKVQFLPSQTFQIIRDGSSEVDLIRGNEVTIKFFISSNSNFKQNISITAKQMPNFIATIEPNAFRLKKKSSMHVSLKLKVSSSRAVSGVKQKFFFTSSNGYYNEISSVTVTLKEVSPLMIYICMLYLQ